MPQSLSPRRQRVKSVVAAFIPDGRWQLETVCNICNAQFNYIRTRHHCRHCGASVCGKHSKNNAIVPSSLSTKPQRVCDRCYPQCQSSAPRARAKTVMEPRPGGSHSTNDTYSTASTRTDSSPLTRVDSTITTRSNPVTSISRQRINSTAKTRSNPSNVGSRWIVRSNSSDTTQSNPIGATARRMERSNSAATTRSNPMDLGARRLLRTNSTGNSRSKVPDTAEKMSKIVSIRALAGANNTDSESIGSHPEPIKKGMNARIGATSSDKRTSSIQKKPEPVLRARNNRPLPFRRGSKRSSEKRYRTSSLDRSEFRFMSSDSSSSYTSSEYNSDEDDSEDDEDEVMKENIPPRRPPRPHTRPKSRQHGGKETISSHQSDSKTLAGGVKKNVPTLSAIKSEGSNSEQAILNVNTFPKNKAHSVLPQHVDEKPRDTGVSVIAEKYMSHRLVKPVSKPEEQEPVLSLPTKPIPPELKSTITPKLSPSIAHLRKESIESAATISVSDSEELDDGKRIGGSSVFSEECYSDEEEEVLAQIITNSRRKGAIPPPEIVPEEDIEDSPTSVATTATYQITDREHGLMSTIHDLELEIVQLQCELPLLLEEWKASEHKVKQLKKQVNESKTRLKMYQKAHAVVNRAIRVSRTYIQKKEYQAAVLELIRAVAIECTNATLWYMLAECRLKLGQLSDAEEACQTSVALQPTAAGVALLGKIFYDQGCHDKAIECYLSALGR